jgi:hypothetical protein
MILKIGSKGEQVKQLQRFLGLNDDGVFGPKTDAAVKKWQQENRLVVDGIVGRQTWNAMGLATTDASDQSKISDTVMIKQHYLPKGEYFDGPTKKNWLFLHHTAGWENPYNTVNNWAKDTRGAIATEFVLGGQKVTNGDAKHDGEVVQAFPAGGYAWHLGTGNAPIHRNSVGIEVCNFGQVVSGKTYVGTAVHPSQIVTLKKPFRGFSVWHRYSDKQIDALKDLILFIANRDNIDVRKGLPDLIRQKGVDAFDVFDIKMCENTPGLWNHTNVRKDKVDMFPQQELIDMLLSL